MAARPRRENESFEAYRNNLKAEQMEADNYARGFNPRLPHQFISGVLGFVNIPRVKAKVHEKLTAAEIKARNALKRMKEHLHDDI